MAEKVIERNLCEIKAAKSVILDDTSDVFNYVKTENDYIVFKCNSATGKNLSDVLLEELDKLDLTIKDLRG